MGKIVLDKDKCIGCGACIAIAENNFTWDEETNLSTVKNDTVTDEAKDAVDSCPVEAIRIEQ